MIKYDYKLWYTLPKVYNFMIKYKTGVHIAYENVEARYEDEATKIFHYNYGNNAIILEVRKV